MLARDPQSSFYPEKNDNKKNKQKNRRVKKVRKKKSNINKSVYILFVMIFLGVSLVLLSRYASITSLRTEITDLENQKEDLVKKRTNLEAKLEGIKSSEVVSREAIIKLGMDYPNENQIIYVEVPKELSKREDNRDLKESLVKAIEAVQIFFRR